jgi:DNA polymerase-3 subunit beta
MRLTVTKRDLAAALQSIRGAVDPKPTQPALGCALLVAEDDRLTATTSNLMVSLIASVPCKVAEAGSMCIPARDVATTLSSLPEGELAISDEDTRCVIKSGKSRLKVPYIDASDFPAPPSPECDSSSPLPDAFADMINATMPAMGSDPQRSHMYGVLVESDGSTVTTTATDGHRAHRVTSGMELPKFRVLVPFGAVREMARFVTGRAASIAVTETHLFLGADGGGCVFRLGDSAAFPPVAKAFPASQPKEIRADRAAMIDALKRVRTVDTLVTMTIEDGSIRLGATSADSGREISDAVDVDYVGKPLTIGVSANLMIDALACIGDAVTIGMSDALGPITVRDAGAIDYAACVMPMRP